MLAPALSGTYNFLPKVSGTKRWILAPPFYPSSVLRSHSLMSVDDEAAGELACAIARGDDRHIRGLRVCEVHPGEALFVPGKGLLSQWSHGTCNLDEWTASYSLFTQGATPQVAGDNLMADAISDASIGGRRTCDHSVYQNDIDNDSKTCKVDPL